MKVIGISLFTIMLGLSALNAQVLATITGDQGPSLLSSTTGSKIGEYPSPSMNSEKKWGYVNNSGAYVIDAEFDYAYEFLNGFALVYVGSKFGYIDKSGALIIEPIFDDAFPINDVGRTIVKKGHKFFLLDMKDLSLEEW
jgi:hypothetical protein